MKQHVFTFACIAAGYLLAAQTTDPYQWLEDVDGKKAMEFVEAENALTLDKLSRQGAYQPIYDKALEILNSNERIVFPGTYRDHVYNFWQDQEHPRGIWRRTSKATYAIGAPVWEVLLDLDAMSKADNVKWVYKGGDGLYPKYGRFLVRLSKGGGDAVVIREFDADSKQFVAGGFEIPESKGIAHYVDENTVVISSDFGEGTMTTSGYPRQVKLWKRDTPLRDAQMLLEGEKSDVRCSGFVVRDGDKSYLIVQRGMTFYTSHSFLWRGNKTLKLDIPDDCQISGIVKGQLILELKSDWNVNGKVYASGTLVSADLEALLAGKKEVRLIFQPDALSSIAGVSVAKSRLLVQLLSNVKGELYLYSFASGVWIRDKVPAPDYGTIAVVDVDEFTGDYYFTFSNFLSPSTLYAGNSDKNSVKSVHALPAFFDGSKYKVEQLKVRSKDGAMVPYFVVSSKALRYDGSNPTLLYGYGGFEVPSLPFYSGTIGSAWLDNGGVFVLANIRGGGEFGPKWHQAGLKEKRQNVYNDFHAIAEDLIAKKITSPKHLGIMGGSNGGLLVGVAFTQRPDLYGAVVCQVPLLDMQRYHKLLAGASWMDEYGDPDKPEEWAYISGYSPYQNLKPNANYPEVLFTTSTRDDRVHPGHARKMVAKMKGMGYNVYYFENTEGGHAGSSTNEQRAKTIALQYSYLLMKLKS